MVKVKVKKKNKKKKNTYNIKRAQSKVRLSSCKHTVFERIWEEFSEPRVARATKRAVLSDIHLSFPSTAKKSCIYTTKRVKGEKSAVEEMKMMLRAVHV